MNGGNKCCVLLLHSLLVSNGAHSFLRRSLSLMCVLLWVCRAGRATRTSPMSRLHPDALCPAPYPRPRTQTQVLIPPLSPNGFLLFFDVVSSVLTLAGGRLHLSFCCESLVGTPCLSSLPPNASSVPAVLPFSALVFSMSAPATFSSSSVRPGFAESCLSPVKAVPKLLKSLLPGGRAAGKEQTAVHQQVHSFTFKPVYSARCLNLNILFTHQLLVLFLLLPWKQSLYRWKHIMNRSSVLSAQLFSEIGNVINQSVCALPICSQLKHVGIISSYTITLSVV